MSLPDKTTEYYGVVPLLLLLVETALKTSLIAKYGRVEQSRTAAALTAALEGAEFRKYSYPAENGCF